MRNPYYKVTLFEPWFLGFCKWEYDLVDQTPGGCVMITPIQRGRWMWRGPRAEYMCFDNSK